MSVHPAAAAVESEEVTAAMAETAAAVTAAAAAETEARADGQAIKAFVT